MNFSDYLNDLPLLHTWDGGETWKLGGLDAGKLERIHQLTGRDASRLRVIETGAGNSTLTFLWAGCERVVSIAPAPALFERIEAYCDEVALDRGALEKHINRSEIELPAITERTLAAGERFDVGFLDGGHGWPTVFVDFCYVNMMLRKGGILWVDDVQLYSVKELARLLDRQPEFRVVADLNKIVAFEKLVDTPMLGDFGSQPYIMERSDEIAGWRNKFSLWEHRADAAPTRGSEKAAEEAGA